jgi:hypothetical protein
MVVPEEDPGVREESGGLEGGVREALFCWSVLLGIHRDYPQGDWVETRLTPNPPNSLPNHVHPVPCSRFHVLHTGIIFHGNCKNFAQVNTARLNIALNKNAIFIGTIIQDFK